MAWLEELFSGAPLDVARFNPIGLIVMLAGLALAALAGRIAKASGRAGLELVLKLGGLLMVMAGALVTVKII